MGLYIHKNGKAYPVGGGMSQSEKDRLRLIEREIEKIKRTYASTERYGAAKISESESVTETESGLVLSAKEKNASEAGTIMNAVSQNITETELRPKIIILRKPIPYTQSEVSFSIQDQGIYLASVSSQFVRGTVYVLARVNSGTSEAVPIAENGNYLKISASGGTDFKVRPGGVSGELTVIRIS